MRILEVRMDGHGLPASIPFAVRPRSNETRNWMTVLSGENGTRKSVLLRLITFAALKKSASGSSHKWVSRADLETAGAVSRVLAASGTYSDRFPQLAGAQISRPLGGFDLDNFSYFGPRFAGNLAGRGRTAAGLLISMLENPVTDTARSKSVASVLECLGYSTTVHALLVPRKDVMDGAQGARGLRQYATRVMGYLGNSEAMFSEELRRFLRELDHESALKEVLYTRDVIVNLDAKQSGEAMPSQVLLPYLKCGMFNVSELKFFPGKGRYVAEGEGVAVDDLSSGQLQMLNTLLNLALCVRDDTLVLIDEPENSLHPEWQREYISLLRRSIACAKRCHVVIATHSPLVASGVQRNEGSLIGLKKNEEDGSLEVVHSETVHGWLPSAVLEERFDMETVRAPELASAVEAALALLKTKGGDKLRLHNVCEQLKTLLAELPPDDVIVPAIEAIIELGDA